MSEEKHICNKKQKVNRLGNWRLFLEKPSDIKFIRLGI